MTYKKEINCEKCGEIVIARSSLKRFCSDCKKINHNEWKKNSLKIEENHEKHKKRIKNWRKNNLDLKRKNQKRYVEKNKEKVKAQQLAKKIPLKENCQICKSKEHLERHHWRYDKPLVVATLCKPCHTIQHNKNILGGI